MSTEIVKFTASDGIILDGILNKCEHFLKRIILLLITVKV